MIKNDFLLRLLLIAGIFLFASPLVAGIALFLWIPLVAAVYVGYAGGALIAIYFHRILFDNIQKSMIVRGGLSTTVRWALYIFGGITIFKYSWQIADAIFYKYPHSLQEALFTGYFKERSIAILITAALLYGSYRAIRALVFELSVIIKPGQGNLLMPQSGSVLDQITKVIAEPKKFSNPFRNKGDKDSAHGSAEFFDRNTFNERYNKKSNRDISSNFEKYGGYSLFPNTIRYIEHTHMVTIAGAGQGKGTTAIIPNLLTKPQESWIVLDVKGENAAVTARFQQQSGQDVYIIDPFDVQKFIKASHGISKKGFNPLVVAKHLPSEEISDFAAMIAEMFIPEAGHKNSSTDSFWADSARNLIKSYILHIITDESIKEKKPWQTVRVASLGSGK